MGSEYPKALKTMGDHLRKRRLDLKLLQREVGERLHVCGLTVTNWELGHTEPGLRDLPAIIAFLGYDPRPEPVDIGDMLVWFREGRGMLQAELAGKIGVDPSTLAKWERGERRPKGRYARKVENAIEGLDFL